MTLTTLSWATALACDAKELINILGCSFQYIIIKLLWDQTSKMKVSGYRQLDPFR